MASDERAVSEALQFLLERPLAFVDTETTGTSTSNDRIIEISVLVLYPPVVTGPQAPYHQTRRLNPGVPIPAEATEVHGITDADVASAPPFCRIARALWDLLNPCDLAGYNLRRFDFPFLRAEFRRCGMAIDHTSRKLIDLQVIFFREEPRDLGAAVRFYAGCELGEVAHSAAGDTAALPLVLEGQLGRYPHLPRDLAGLHAYCDEFAPFVGPVQDWFGPDPEHPVFQRGKNKDRTLAEVLQDDAGYIGWMLTKAEDMDEEVREFIRDFRRQVYGAVR